MTGDSVCVMERTREPIILDFDIDSCTFFRARAQAARDGRHPTVT